jgi:hypothetical protein
VRSWRAADSRSAARSTVPESFLLQGFSANLSVLAHPIAQLPKEFAISERPNPSPSANLNCLNSITALRLARLFETSPQFWMRLQADWDLHRAMTRAAKAS